jgi:putative membrane protein
VRKLIFQIIVSLISLWLADRFLPGVTFEGSTSFFILCGSALGLINFFIKPILKKITFPLRLLTLGFFNIVINMGILWFVDVAFPELTIMRAFPLFLTTCIMSVVGLIFSPLT